MALKHFGILVQPIMRIKFLFMFSLLCESCNPGSNHESLENLIYTQTELTKGIRFLAIPRVITLDTFVMSGQMVLKIDNVIWATNNLNTQVFCNGDSITELRELGEWRNTTEAAWCYYDNNPEYGVTHGKLYNWHAVNDSRGLCPCGWQVASMSDWIALVDHFGGAYISPSYLMSDTIWDDLSSVRPNNPFNAMPSGFRPTPEGSSHGGDFDGLSGSVWWSSTRDTTYIEPFEIPNSTAKGMDLGSSNAYRANDGTFVGKSVRCVIKVE